ncbi:alpha/beta hydrolase [Streptomyces sp. NPDC096934]|uniref:alpha/beta fold hydrolase n=1 Tax=Streptomyces sp. NPDC096934 TaxID=3155551 RepID=UPI00332B2C16
MSSRIDPQYKTIDGLSIRYAESGKSGGPDALLLAPWPESVFAFDRAWDRLSREAHLVAVDLPGFGKSDYRESLMNSKAMGDFIIKIADAFGLEKPHVVAPDIGTSAVLFAATAQPDRLSSLVVGSGATVVPIQLGGALREWVETTDLEPYRQRDGGDVVKMVLTTIKDFTPSDEIRTDYIESFQGDRFLKSMTYVRNYPEQLAALADLLPDIQVPVCVVAGAADDAVPVVNNEFLHARLPHSSLQLIEGAGHFCWEEQPDAYADRVTNWWKSGHTSV